MRRLALLLSLLCLVLICVVTISCGGSSKSTTTTNCNAPSVDVVGDWTFNGTSSSGSVSGTGVINSSGLAVFFQAGGSTEGQGAGDTTVMPTISGTECFSGTATFYATPFSDPPSGGSESDSVQGTVNSSSSITGTLSNGNSFSLTSSSPLTGSVTAVSGTRYIGEIEGWTGTDNVWRLDFEPTGSGASMNFGGSNDQCDINGTITQEGSVAADLNVFDVSITYTQEAGCPESGSGVGFESSVDYFHISEGQPGPYFYAVLSNGASVLEILNSTP